MAKGDVSLLFSVSFIFMMVIFGLIPQFIAPYNYWEARLPEKFKPPSLEYPFGTDFVGRDVMSLIIWGSGVALLVIIIPTIISAAVGVSLGIFSGYVGGTVDDIVMRGIDIIMAFPGLLLSLTIINVLGPGLWNAMWSVTIGRIPGYARLARSLTFSIKESGYVEYAKALGSGRTRIIIRYVLPNILTPIIVQLTFSMPATLLAVASLSFLGLGPSPPTADWGVLMQQSRTYLLYAPWAAIIPGVFIFLVAFSFNNIGEALRDVVDPRSKYIRI